MNVRHVCASQVIAPQLMGRPVSLQASAVDAMAVAGISEDISRLLGLRQETEQVRYVW